jgi:hypothetical protein
MGYLRGLNGASSLFGEDDHFISKPTVLQMSDPEHFALSLT